MVVSTVTSGRIEMDHLFDLDFDLMDGCGFDGRLAILGCLDLSFDIYDRLAVQILGPPDHVMGNKAFLFG